MATPDVVLPTDTFDDSSIFENKSGLAEDMRFLASMPELCDVTFLVGDTREPVCAVKAVLCARSRYCKLSVNGFRINMNVYCYRVFQNILGQSKPPKKEESRKKELSKGENKIKAFIKRSSEPLLNMHMMAGSNVQHTQQVPSSHQTLIIEEFEPDVFRQLIEYTHTGCVTLQPRTLLGKRKIFHSV